MCLVMWCPLTLVFEYFVTNFTGENWQTVSSHVFASMPRYICIFLTTFFAGVAVVTMRGGWKCRTLCCPCDGGIFLQLLLIITLVTLLMNGQIDFLHKSNAADLGRILRSRIWRWDRRYMRLLLGSRIITILIVAHTDVLNSNHSACLTFQSVTYIDENSDVIIAHYKALNLHKNRKIYLFNKTSLRMNICRMSCVSFDNQQCNWAKRRMSSIDTFYEIRCCAVRRLASGEWTRATKILHHIHYNAGPQILIQNIWSSVSVWCVRLRLRHRKSYLTLLDMTANHSTTNTWVAILFDGILRCVEIVAC